jgi:D-lactate dehydrogenase
MKVLVYSSNPYTRQMLTAANWPKQHEFIHSETQLNAKTAALAAGYDAICCFVEDDLGAETLAVLAKSAVKLVLLRCTGFSNVDLEAAERSGITVMRVAEYSPYSVAEFSVGLILALNRQIHRAYNRVKEGNFTLDGLLGFDLNNKVVGIVGTGRIGTALANIMLGFNCRVIAYDVVESEHCRKIGVIYTSLEELLGESDIVSLNVPLTPDTHHMINRTTLGLMKPHAMLINTSRGAIIDTDDLIHALKRRQLGAVGLDVYEEESHLYYHDLRDQIIDDDKLMRLLTFPNVLVTAHQGFFTREALEQIANTTIRNLNDFTCGIGNRNTLHPRSHVAPMKHDAA